MCKKQCRDQNGFKCHLTSETHQRQLLLFAENTETYLKEYSVEFERNFLNVSLFLLLNIIQTSVLLLLVRQLQVIQILQFVAG